LEPLLINFLFNRMTVDKKQCSILKDSTADSFLGGGRQRIARLASLCWTCIRNWRTEAGRGENSLTRSQSTHTLPNIPFILPILLSAVLQLLSPGGNFHLPGTSQAAGPVLEGHAGVAQVGVFEREHLVAGRRGWTGCRTGRAEFDPFTQPTDEIFHPVWNERAGKEVNSRSDHCKSRKMLQ